MQISLKWINELINLKAINLDKLIDKLTLGGFEVEDIIELTINQTKQTALEISSTANRSDSLSVQGISAEIMALFDQPEVSSNYLLKSFDWKQKINSQTIKTIDNSSCSTFIAVTIENFNKVIVPQWIKNKLISSDIIPTDTLLDFQNYIILETGYPLVIYDLEKIYSKLDESEFNLKISNDNNQTSFTGINKIKYELDEATLVLKANNVPISIAGIIENQDFIYSNSTNSLLVEASIFNAASIRQQSRGLSLRTDRSARYEKSLKNTYLIEALYRLISLLRIENPNLYCKFHTSSSVPEQTLPAILLQYKTINEILGPTKESTINKKVYISTDLITSYLNRLKFNFTFDNVNQNWKVDIPSLRSEDITREIDLIEEIGRLHGFDNFLTLLPTINNIGIEDNSYQIRKKITPCLLNLGLNELINYSLVSDKTFLKNDIALVNPLLIDCSNLRKSLLPSLITTVSDNFKQNNLILEGFEYGHVFSEKNLLKFNEQENIAGIFGGNEIKSNWSEKTKTLSWFEAKGKIEKLFTQLNISTNWIKKSNSVMEEIFHPYRSAEIYLKNGKMLGVFGQIHPLLAKKLMLPAEIYLFEFSLEQIQDQTYKLSLPMYNEYSIYPKIVKDLSFIIKQTISFNDIQNIVHLNGTKFLSKITLLDEYNGKGIPSDCTSLCLQLTFQSETKTLKNNEIDLVIKNIESVLEKKFEVQLRN